MTPSCTSATTSAQWTGYVPTRAVLFVDAAVFNRTGPRAVLFVDAAVFNRIGPRAVRISCTLLPIRCNLTRDWLSQVVANWVANRQSIDALSRTQYVMKSAVSLAVWMLSAFLPMMIYRCLCSVLSAIDPQLT
jgi:hypothetical protein